MPQSRLFTPVLIGGAIILMLSFAVRASFGVFQIPIAEEFGWPRAEFSLAIAIQNLAWGIGQPIFGALAERFGDRRAIIAGAGGAAHLPGMLASLTALPVIGVPVPGGPLNGIDALLAIAQCPGGVPCTTVGLHKKTPVNAAMAAHRILKLAGL